MINAYQFVLDDAGLNANECLFIDDSIQNIDPAKQVGMNAYHLKEGEDMIDLFEDGKLKPIW